MYVARYRVAADGYVHFFGLRVTANNTPRWILVKVLLYLLRSCTAGADKLGPDLAFTPYTHLIFLYNSLTPWKLLFILPFKNYGGAHGEVMIFTAGNMARYIGIIVLVLIIPFSAGAFERYNNVIRYDRYFTKYTKRYFGSGFDWRYFKAQAVAESRLREKVRSHVGAMGIMQIMPKTFREISRKNQTIRGTREQPRWNIAAGIYYDRQLWKMWKAERQFQDRIGFMFGSYNAGKGNVLKAQKRAEREGLDPNLWESIEATLPGVTGKRSRETIGYVKKIDTIKGVLR